MNYSNTFLYVAFTLNIDLILLILYSYPSNIEFNCVTPILDECPAACCVMRFLAYITEVLITWKFTLPDPPPLAPLMADRGYIVMTVEYMDAISIQLTFIAHGAP